MTVSPNPVAALRASHDNLRALVSPLTEEQFRERAYPTEWSIAQVLSHLGSAAQINLLSVDAGVAGQEPPARELYQGIWDTWNAKSPEDQVADGLAMDAKLVTKLEELAAVGSAARFRIWVGEVDVTGMAAFRVFEHAVHTWDVAVALDPTATLPADAAEIILSGLAQLIGFVAKPGGRTDRIHVITTEPAQEFGLTLGEPSTFRAWDGGAATATVRLPGEAFVRLVYGRLDDDHTPAVELDGITLDDLRTVFPGF